jgi:hypothetical protein
MKRLAQPGEQGAQPPSQEQFECFFLCADCGFLEPENQEVCPGCSQSTWLDLRHHATADQVRDEELAERQRVPWWVKVVTLATAIVFLGAATWLSGPTPTSVSAAAIGVLLVYLAGNRSMACLLVRSIDKRPHRWRLPIPLPARGAQARQRVHGEATRADKILQAPFSGRECLAYQVSVLFDAPGDARPPEWVLQEAKGVDFSVNGERIPGVRALVQKPMQLISTDEDKESELKLSRFLRERGLFLSDGEFTLFEATVEPGEEVQVHFFEDTEAVTLSDHSDLRLQ